MGFIPAVAIFCLLRSRSYYLLCLGLFGIGTIRIPTDCYLQLMGSYLMKTRWVSIICSSSWSNHRSIALPFVDLHHSLLTIRFRDPDLLYFLQYCHCLIQDLGCSLYFDEHYSHCRLAMMKWSGTSITRPPITDKNHRAEYSLVSFFKFTPWIIASIAWSCLPWFLHLLSPHQHHLLPRY